MLGVGGGVAAAADGASFARFLRGQDVAPVPIETGDVAQHVSDPFANIVLGQGERPQTLGAILASLDAATGPDAVPEQRIYRVADGGQIPWSAAQSTLPRHLRLVLTRHRAQDAEIFLSTAPPFDSTTIFLQVFAWDPVRSAYNFYERRDGVWFWAGSSWNALDPPTRGLGPFDSHVNGSPIMKELKIPWLHWQSQSAQIRDDILAPNDPLRQDPLYHSPSVKGAEDLELLVRAGTTRWTNARFGANTSGSVLRKLPQFMRQCLGTTSVNIACSPQQTSSLASSEVLRLPSTFFLNSEILLDDLALPATLPRLKVAPAFYLSCLDRFQVQLRDGRHTLEQDTFFAFAVPEPSLEDRAVVAELVRRGVLSRRLAASLLMVDFANPIYSRRRERLLEYVPDEAESGDGSDLDRRFIATVEAAAAAAVDGTPETELLGNWRQPDDSWESGFASRLEAYWARLADRLGTQDGFDDIFKLAESRRRQFRKRPLAEFGLTLSVAAGLDLPQPLGMNEDATLMTLEA